MIIHDATREKQAKSFGLGCSRHRCADISAGIEVSDALSEDVCVRFLRCICTQIHTKLYQKREKMSNFEQDIQDIQDIQDKRHLFAVEPFG